jgi:predicted XRE-type DNA-binding protein
LYNGGFKEVAMYDEGLIQRFHEKYRKNKDSGCWEWTASLAGKGYGQLKLTGQRKQVYAHRVSFEIFKGEVPKDKYILHKCDNPKCVNPDHLSIGSQKDNMQDMKNKGRSTYGERNSKSILTEVEVITILDLLKKGELSQEKIANMFGVQQMEISRIKRGLRWGYLGQNL